MNLIGDLQQLQANLKDEEYLRSPSGNIFQITADVVVILRKIKYSALIEELEHRVFHADSYEMALKIVDDVINAAIEEIRSCIKK